MKSPYAGQPESAWPRITEQLLQKHPLKPDVLLQVATAAWVLLWQTTVGAGDAAIKLADIRVPATVVGYFFEILLARVLEQRFLGIWRGGDSTMDEKDVVYVPNPQLSMEVKTSGQAGFKVYGNRSYGQKPATELLAKKEKSGFYITANFFRQTLTLLRFGWIDEDDWKPQKSQTGQMAGLPDRVYSGKLVSIAGVYRRQAPIHLLKGVGPKTQEEFARYQVSTIEDLLTCTTLLPARLEKIKAQNQWFLEGCS